VCSHPFIATHTPTYTSHTNKRIDRSYKLTHTQLHTVTNTQTHVRTHAHFHARTLSHSHIQIRTHTHTHTYIDVSMYMISGGKEGAITHKYIHKYPHMTHTHLLVSTLQHKNFSLPRIEQDSARCCNMPQHSTLKVVNTIRDMSRLLPQLTR